MERTELQDKVQSLTTSIDTAVIALQEVQRTHKELTDYLAGPVVPLVLTVDVGDGRQGTLTMPSILKGTQVVRADFTGSWSGYAFQRDPANPDNYIVGAWKTGQLVVGGHPWAGTLGPDEFLNDRRKMEVPSWLEGDCDTTVFGDGPVPILWWVDETFTPDGQSRVVGIAHGTVSFANGTANRSPLPSIAEIHVSSGQAITLPSVHWLHCDGSVGSEIQPQEVTWTSSDPAIATLHAGTVAFTGGECYFTATSQGKQARVRVFVQPQGNVIPHFQRDGKGTALYYDPATSFFPVSCIGMGNVDMNTSPGVEDLWRAAGITACPMDFALDPRNYTSLDSFKAAIDGHADANAGDVLRRWPEVHFSFQGDNIFRSRAIFDAYLYLHPWSQDALKYVIEKIVATGRAAFFSSVDEMVGYGSDPNNIPLDPLWPNITSDSWDLAIQIMRSVPGCPPISHPGGGPLWHTPDIAGCVDVYPTAPIDARHADPLRGPSPDQYRRQARLAFGGGGAWKGMVSWCPRIYLIAVTGDNYLVGTPGHQDYDPSLGDVLLHAGTPPESITAQAGLVLVHRCAGVRYYGYDTYFTRLDRMNGAAGSEHQTGIYPGTPRWQAMSVANNWFHDHVAYVLSPPSPAPHFGPDWETSARDGGNGRRMIVAVNFSGRDLPCPGTPGGFGPPALLTPTDYAPLDSRKVPSGCMVVWLA